jgi:hypothetical protein
MRPFDGGVHGSHDERKKSRRAGDSFALDHRVRNEAFVDLPFRHRRPCAALVADGMAADLEFRSVVQSNIARSGGIPTAREARFLRAIGNSLRESGMSEQEIRAELRLPNIFQMFEQLGYGRAYYVAVQGMQSHAIHGTWSDLVSGYLDIGETIRPRGTNNVPNAGQYGGIALAVLGALIDYVGVLLTDEAAEHVQEGLRGVHEWVNTTYEEVCAYELEPEQRVL